MLLHSLLRNSLLGKAVSKDTTPPLNDRHDPIVIACALFRYAEIEVYAPNGKMLLAGKRGEPRWQWVVPKPKP